MPAIDRSHRDQSVCASKQHKAPHTGHCTHTQDTSHEATTSTRHAAPVLGPATLCALHISHLCRPLHASHEQRIAIRVRRVCTLASANRRATAPTPSPQPMMHGDAKHPLSTHSHLATHHKFTPARTNADLRVATRVQLTLCAPASQSPSLPALHGLLTCLNCGLGLHRSESVSPHRSDVWCDLDNLALIALDTSSHHRLDPLLLLLEIRARREDPL